MLAGRADFDVVAVAASGSEAVQAAGRTQPDVAVVDLRMPDGNGIAAVRGNTRARLSAHYGAMRKTPLCR